MELRFGGESNIKSLLAGEIPDCLTLYNFPILDGMSFDDFSKITKVTLCGGDIQDVSVLGGVCILHLIGLQNVMDVSVLSDVHELHLIRLPMVEDIHTLRKINTLVLDTLPKIKDVNALVGVSSLKLISLINVHDISGLKGVKNKILDNIILK